MTTIEEGKVRKGGVNEAPREPRPEPPAPALIPRERLTEAQRAALDAIEHIRELGRILPGVSHCTPGEAARLAYLDGERCVRRAFGLPDLPTDASGHFIRQAADEWPPERGS